MRIFLTFIVFDMCFRSVTVVLPWRDWAKELKVETAPVRFPTRAEIANFPVKPTDEHPDPLGDDIRKTLRSVRSFYNPWPGEKTRAKITDLRSGGKYAAVWLITRLDLLESTVGINEEWPMFSPSVSQSRWIARARVIYEDGSERLVRQLADPEDLTHYSHWFQEKKLDYELKVRHKWNDQDEYYGDDECNGWCNLLAHRYARNEAGSPVWRVVIYDVKYRYPPPGADAAAYLREQMRLTRHLTREEYLANLPELPPRSERHLRLVRSALPDQVYADYFEYDPTASPPRGRFLPQPR
jgi:hypothetical protein